MAPHPFFGHHWCGRDSDRGIAWGVLATPSVTHLLRVVTEQDVEDEIRCPRYLIGATGQGAARLRQDPEDGEDLDETHEPPNGRYPFFNRAIWEESAGAVDGARAMAEEEEWFDADEWVQAEAEGAARAPPGAGVIVVDDGGVSIETEQGLRSKLDS